ncbi:MAG TPA: hypothetical protein DEF12_07015 [Rhodobacteraceae bacterium]|jgi:hypothetical protein|nr:hypothetical protein [Paracoccaceae bacterium]HBV54774.1 hypothetical protein [Paracoccaceae bacterium]
MSSAAELADELAQETLDLVAVTGDSDLIRQVSEKLATSSTVAQEAFMSAVRLRMAIARAKEFLDEKRIAANSAQKSE